MSEIKESIMNESVKELVAIGASVGAHCEPCLSHHIKAALELGIQETDIRQAIEAGHRVEKGAMAAMKKNSAAVMDKYFASVPPENLTQQAFSAQQQDSTILKIYDPALCCSSGVCGPSVDPVLAQFAGSLKVAAAQPGIQVERYNLSQQPQAFVENAAVKTLLADGGEKLLPFIFINDQLWLKGRYPSKDEFFQALQIKALPTPLPVETIGNSPCCGEEGCC